jgi:hypothetical protein
LDEIKPLIASNPPLFAAIPDTAALSGRRFTRHHNTSGTNLSVASFGSSAASSIRHHSLPASPPSTSAEKATSSGEMHTQLTRELLEIHVSESRLAALSHSLVGISPGDDAYSRQSEHLENDILEALSDPFDNFSTHTTYDILWEDPVLRLYVIEMFVHHAVAANEAGADPSELLEMIHDGQTSKVADGCWYKWCQLNDDLNADTTPAYFAAEWNLESWIKWYSNHSSYQYMLDKRGGDLQYPLLAAIYLGHDSIVACLSNHLDAEIPLEDAWTLLHYLAANKVKADITLERCEFNHELLDQLLSLSASVLSDSFRLSFRFRDYIERSGVSVQVF